jgi:hypothetical protein
MNRDIFAWSPLDMPDIPRDVAEHALEIRANAKPVKQRLCRFDEEKHKAIRVDICKLLEAGFIKDKLRDAWPLSASSSRASANEGCHSTSF